MNIKAEVRKMKLASPFVAATSEEERNRALMAVKTALLGNKTVIFEANMADLEAAASAGITEAIVKRLKFDEQKLADCIDGIDQLIGLPDPIGMTTLARQLDEGLQLFRVTCPIGVIGVIFEARPDALVQISCLCIKSGNCAILKGGRETAASNKVLFNLIHDAAAGEGLPSECLLQAEQHNEISELLQCHDYVDLLIPRGSNEFVRYIMDNTKIPVMGHADGVCHTYVDERCDLEKAIRIVVDAKTQYTAACNATETLLVNRKAASGPLLLSLVNALAKAGVKLNVSAEVVEILKEHNPENIPDMTVISEDDFGREYLDKEISIKIVEDVLEAVQHINSFGSHHTDCIISSDSENIDTFMRLVDSADVYANCSTRFADGFRYGLGAEVGISTGKIHARGPVGLEGLVTYKYRLYGDGHIVGDYAEGRRKFDFKES
ncbi:MAG: glutamate-5-semialdehyde dehydrogenase [Lachnospiraceae bacterium]|jgi:glutamate-5-semialdehyde dehydrogenase